MNDEESRASSVSVVFSRASRRQRRQRRQRRKIRSYQRAHLGGERRHAAHFKLQGHKMAESSIQPSTPSGEFSIVSSSSIVAARRSRARPPQPCAICLAPAFCCHFNGRTPVCAACAAFYRRVESGRRSSSFAWIVDEQSQAENIMFVLAIGRASARAPTVVEFASRAAFDAAFDLACLQMVCRLKSGWATRISRLLQPSAVWQPAARRLPASSPSTTTVATRCLRESSSRSVQTI